jgi:hypothetical protein
MDAHFVAEQVICCVVGLFDNPLKKQFIQSEYKLLYAIDTKKSPQNLQALTTNKLF